MFYWNITNDVINKKKLVLELQMNFIFFGRKDFHQNPLFVRIFAHFETDKEIDNCSIGNKTTNIFKQNSKFNGHYIVYELNIISKSGYHECPPGYDKVDWFVDEVMKLEKKWLSSLKTLMKILIWLKMNITTDILMFVDFVKNNCYPINLEIIVIWQGKIEVQPLKNVILVSQRNKVILIQFYFTILVIMIVIFFSRGWSTKRMIK